MKHGRERCIYIRDIIYQIRHTLHVHVYQLFRYLCQLRVCEMMLHQREVEGSVTHRHPCVCHVILHLEVAYIIGWCVIIMLGALTYGAYVFTML